METSEWILGTMTEIWHTAWMTRNEANAFLQFLPYMLQPEFDGNEEEMPWILATQSQHPRHFSNNASNYKHIDNMDYSMPYIDIFIFAFSCLISPILKHFFGIEIPNESRIKARSGSSISQKR